MNGLSAEARLYGLLSDVAELLLLKGVAPETQFQIDHARERDWLETSLKELELRGLIERSQGKIELTPFGLQSAQGPRAKRARELAADLLEYIKRRAASEGVAFKELRWDELTSAQPPAVQDDQDFQLISTVGQMLGLTNGGSTSMGANGPTSGRWPVPLNSVADLMLVGGFSALVERTKSDPTQRHLTISREELLAELHVFHSVDYPTVEDWTRGVARRLTSSRRFELRTLVSASINQNLSAERRLAARSEVAEYLLNLLIECSFPPGRLPSTETVKALIQLISTSVARAPGLLSGQELFRETTCSREEFARAVALLSDNKAIELVVAGTFYDLRVDVARASVLMSRLSAAPAAVESRRESAAPTSKSGKQINLVVSALVLVLVAALGAYMFVQPVAKTQDLKGVKAVAQEVLSEPKSNDWCQDRTNKVAQYVCCINGALMKRNLERVSHRELKQFDKDAGLKSKGMEGSIGTVAEVDSSIEALFSGKPDKEVLDKIRRDCRELADEPPPPAPQNSKPKETEKPKASTPQTGSLPLKTFTCTYQIVDGGPTEEAVKAKNRSGAERDCTAKCENKFKKDCQLE